MREGRGDGWRRVTTLGASAPSLPNQEGSLLGVPGRGTQLQKIAVYPIMYMKTKMVTGNPGDLSRNCISLMVKDLPKSGGRGGGKRGIKKCRLIPLCY